MIFPLLLFAYIFLVYLGIFQYDRCVLEQDLRYVLVRTKEVSKMDEGEKETFLQQVFEEINADKGLAVTLKEIDFETKYDGVKGNVTSQMAVPFLQISENGLGLVWDLQVGGEADLWNPVGFIRLCERMKRGTADGSDRKFESEIPENTFEGRE